MVPMVSLLYIDVTAVCVAYFSVELSAQSLEFHAKMVQLYART